MSYHQHPRFNPPSATKVVQPLPRKRRQFLFWSLLTLFICAVPVFVFYATGYRYNIFAPDASITATGGLYISVGQDTGEVFLNNQPVQDSRIFRSALYIQNLNPGLQRLHVQAPGYHTWVKELPVYAHIVTEANAFLVPVIPQVRPISQYLSSTGTAVFVGVSTTTKLFDQVSSTIPFEATTSRATSTLTLNSEYAYVKNLFATTTASTSEPFINRVVDEARGIFVPEATSTANDAASTSVATTTVIVRDMMLFERDGQVSVRYLGGERTIPYYFCIPDDIGSSTSERYEAQVIAARHALAQEQLEADKLETTTSAARDCRREIAIDNQGQEVIMFTFMPGTTDLVLMHRADGVFVTEVDDRAWQNTQRLHGPVDAVVLDGDRIYVRDGSQYFELLTELPTE
jgi:hypothetical protein